jgi:uncharacterized damage-inducible protein DinB
VGLLNNFRLLARYNEAMNRKLYQAAQTLTESAYKENRNAFFQSIHGTLNHLVVTDLLWLKRFADHEPERRALDPVRAMPSPVALNQILHDDLESLSAVRSTVDTTIIAWADGMEEPVVSSTLTYRNTRGITTRLDFDSAILHFFNHQTHHRGQATTLFSQCGVDVGVTDFLAVIPKTADR